MRRKPEAASSTKADAPEHWQAQDVLTRLRSDIVSSVYDPAERLKFADLRARYDVGIGTLREALSQLVSEGFVVVEVGKGFKVAPVSIKELNEITDLFLDLEKRALRSAIDNGNENWETTIVGLHYKLNLIESLPWQDRMARHSEWVQRHRDFHDALVAACTDAWLFRLRSMMFNQLDRYRFVTKKTPLGLGEHKFIEHREIMDATIARNADAATSLLEEHIRDTSRRAIDLL
ncbi:FCD domain-containing protein [Thioclava sp. BHET1]|nr:FCD domain-containing protein [Thioclava sp. BHET1]